MFFMAGSSSETAFSLDSALGASAAVLCGALWFPKAQAQEGDRSELWAAEKAPHICAKNDVLYPALMSSTDGDFLRDLALG
jgi:hypothetical protein